MNNKRRYPPRKIRKPQSREPMRPGFGQKPEKDLCLNRGAQKKAFVPDPFQVEAIETIKEC
jgi:hypothetical protein